MSKTETALYPVAEVQGLYRTIAELRQQVASADLIRADAMERMQQQDQTIDALKGRVVELEATLRAAKAHAQALSVAIINGMADLTPDMHDRDYTGHINIMAAHGDPDYQRGSLSCRHVDMRSTKPRKVKA